MSYRKNLIEYWRQYIPNWNIPVGYHVHHIKPRCTFEDRNDPRIDNARNLIALHPDDHASVHALRGDKWCASMIMSMKDRVVTEETKQKLREINMGKVPSDKTRALWRKQRKGTKVGELNHMYKKNHKPESIAKMIESRSGLNHSSVNGHYVTPWGRFVTAGDAAEASTYDLNLTSLRRWCRNNCDNVIRKQSYRQCKYLNDLGEEVIGKTFREIGFYYEPFYEGFFGSIK